MTLTERASRCSLLRIDRYQKGDCDGIGDEQEHRRDHIPENLALATKVMDFRMKCAKPGCGYNFAHFAFGGSPFPVPEAIQEALKKHSGDGDYLHALGVEPLKSLTFRVASVNYDGEKALAAYLDDSPKGSDQERVFVKSQAPRLVLESFDCVGGSTRCDAGSAQLCCS